MLTDPNRLLAWPDPANPGAPVIRHDDSKLCLLSGDKVVADHATVEQHLLTNKDAIGVEMEAAGVGAALEVLEEVRTHFFVIRAISDHAGADKRSNLSAAKRQLKEKWHMYASAVAGAFTVEFLEVLRNDRLLERL